jgi:hypothetical protein
MVIGGNLDCATGLYLARAALLKLLFSAAVAGYAVLSHLQQAS